MSGAAQALYSQGFHDIISVSHPGLSHLFGDAAGKMPATPLQTSEGIVWRGSMDWQNSGRASFRDVREWDEAGANVGVLGAAFPAVDIDVTDEHLSRKIMHHVFEALGVTPVRTGRPPKRLLPYRARHDGVRFAQKKIVFVYEGEKHAIELMGTGRQWVAAGTHPSGDTYKWDRSPRASDCPLVRPDEIGDLWESLKATLESYGCTDVKYVGTASGGRKAVQTVDEASLFADDDDDVKFILRYLRNDYRDAFDYDEWILVLAAIFNATRGENRGREIAEKWSEWNPKHSRKEFRKQWDRWLSKSGNRTLGIQYLIDLAKERDASFSRAWMERKPDFHPIPDGVEEEPGPAMAEAHPLIGTDYALADVVVRDEIDGKLYRTDAGRWVAWDPRSNRWEGIQMEVAKGKIASVARDYATRLSEMELIPLKRLKDLHSARGVSGVVKEAIADPRLHLRETEFGKHKYLLGLEGGWVFDCRTYETRRARPGDFMDRETAVRPDPKCPTPVFSKFIREITCGDEDLALYLQRIMGAAINGESDPRSFFLFQGAGRNGKSVFGEIIVRALGDFASTPPGHEFLQRRTGNAEYRGHQLKGSRLAFVEEVNGLLDSEYIKAVSGKSRMYARSPYGRGAAFKPESVVVMTTNGFPEFSHMDNGLLERLQVVPFDLSVSDDDVDPFLLRKLEQELPGILSWCLEGVRIQQESFGGLFLDSTTPRAVLIATSEAEAEGDVYTGFLKERCRRDEHGPGVSISEAYLAFMDYCETRSEEPDSKIQFARVFRRLLKTTGHRQQKSGKTKDGRRGFQGICLVSPSTEFDPVDEDDEIGEDLNEPWQE